MKKLLFFALLLLCFFAPQAQAQELARRPLFGIRMENLDDENARNLQLPVRSGVLIVGTVPGSTAEAAGLQRGDVLLQINGIAVNSGEEAIKQVRQLPAGQQFSYKLLRSGGEISGEATVRGFPEEKFPDFEVEYGAIWANDALLRTILTKPRQAGRRPAVLFVQGVACYSLDSPLDTTTAELQLLGALTRSGFVTLRVEKPGMGDSQGGPCTQVDFLSEGEAYRQALRRLRSLDGVDSNRIFLIGHSMGGVFAPLIARDIPVRGIAVYGALAANFMEYFINSRRTIAQAQGLTPAQTDTYIKMHCECFLPYIADGIPMETIVRDKPRCRDYLGDLGRPMAFWRQLYEVNIPDLWSTYPGKVLAVWGKSDFISNREEHRQIAETVNDRHPGNGRFVELEHCDHGMHVAASFQEAAENPGEVNPAVKNAIRQWLLDNI